MVPMGTFRFVTLTLRYPPMEIGENIGIYIAQMVLTNLSPIFTRGKNVNFGHRFWQGLELAAFGLLIAYCVCVKVPPCLMNDVQTQTSRDDVDVGCQTDDVDSVDHITHAVIC